MKRIRLGVMISGTGRTLKNFIDGIRSGDLPAEIPLVISSDPEAYGITYGKEAGIPVEVISPRDHRGVAAYSEAIVAALREARVDLVCMAGFIHLWKIPEDLEGKVMNIHPALIPAFCGKGFYGSHVHETALQRGVKISGCTVHFADSVYDHGPIILQKAVPVLEGDDPDALAARIFEKECEAYPEAIRLFAEGRLRIVDRRVEVLPGDPADT